MSRAERRHNEKKKQTKRLNHAQRRYYNDIEDGEHERLVGQLKNSHNSCGCSLCKPWKYGFESKYKPSERRELQEVVND